MEKNVKKVYDIITEQKTRSAWMKGVKEYALELLDMDHLNFTDQNVQLVRKQLLNGADDWEQFSWGGSSLIYDYDIAERLCSPSELKRTKNGERRPNNREEWLDVQARALMQACGLIKAIYRQHVSDVEELARKEQDEE